MKIDKNSRIPLYYQLMEIIIKDIEEGNIKENDKLSSEKELCDYHNISRATVRQAIQELEKMGYVYKHRGKGTYISSVKIKQNLFGIYSFYKEMNKIGKVPTSEILDFEIINCDRKIASKMNIDIDEKVYKFTRLRRADTIPMMIEYKYLLYNRFPGLDKDDIERNSLYDILTKKFNAKFDKAEETLQPVVTKSSEAKILCISKEIPSMMIERTTYENDQIIEYTVGIASGDKFKYSVILKDK